MMFRVTFKVQAGRTACQCSNGVIAKVGDHASRGGGKGSVLESRHFARRALLARSALRRYDVRDRVCDRWWDNNAAPATSIRYDAASRVTNIETPETAVHYGYNDANRVTSEEQTLSGYPTRRIEKAA